MLNDFYIIKQLVRTSHLVVVKIEATVVEEKSIDGNKDIYLLEAHGISARGKQSSSYYAELERTPENFTKLSDLAEVLNAWR